MKKLVIFIFVAVTIFVTYRLYKTYINPPANYEVRYKLSLIDEKIRKKGYRNWYFVSSGKRSKRYNDFLKTAKKSYHLYGKAIDIIVLDIDGDWVFNNKDIAILEKINKEVEREHPELIGAFGTYRKEGGIFYNMVHIDTRGYKLRYDQ